MLNSAGIEKNSESEYFMSDTFRQVDRDTLCLLPPSMDEWLTEGHLARFVVDILGQLDLTAIKSTYAGRGSKTGLVLVNHKVSSDFLRRWRLIDNCSLLR